jgi:hypothetical protein
MLLQYISSHEVVLGCSRTCFMVVEVRVQFSLVKSKNCHQVNLCLHCIIFNFIFQKQSGGVARPLLGCKFSHMCGFGDDPKKLLLLLF